MVFIFIVVVVVSGVVVSAVVSGVVPAEVGAGTTPQQQEPPCPAAVATTPSKVLVVQGAREQERRQTGPVLG